MLVVANYANGEPFESFRKYNTKSAYKYGKVDKVLEYKYSDIPQSYIESHKNIFAYTRGAGLWLWKPFIINDALGKINFGDWLMYLDSGTFVIDDIHKLINFSNLQNQDIFIMEQPLLCRQFTKRECYVKLGLEEKGENQALGLLLLKKTNKSIKFINEWLHCCEQEELISPNKTDLSIQEFSDYYEHREDQSLLSLLCIKYKLPLFRDCSDYGEMPFMYFGKDKYDYRPKKYPQCTYPTIILCNRKVHPYLYWIKYIIKHYLHKYNIYYTEKKFIQ